MPIWCWTGYPYGILTYCIYGGGFNLHVPTVQSIKQQFALLLHYVLFFYYIFTCFDNKLLEQLFEPHLYKINHIS